MKNFSPGVIGLIYVVSIPLFAGVYYLTPGQWREPLTVVDSFYLSSITITTLGYGDITPIGDAAKILVSIQAVFGVTLIGLFLLSLSRYLQDRTSAQSRNADRVNMRSQYRQFREDYISHVLETINYTFEKRIVLSRKLLNPEEFKRYFGGHSEGWYEYVNELQTNERARTEARFLLLDLERNLASFVLRSSTSDAKAIEYLSNFRNFLHRLQRLNLESSDELKGFARQMYGVVAQFDLMKGYTEHDELLQFIDKA